MDRRLLSFDTVVFDVGNVLLSFEPDKVSELLPAAHRAALREALFGPEGRWYGFDLGRTPNEALASEIAAAAGVPEGGPLILHALHHFYETMTPLPLYHALGELRARGKRFFLLTNYAEPAFRLTREAFPALRAAAGAVVSSHEKVCKPDPEIYRILIRRYGLDPARCLYIDDAERNIRAGEAAGFRVWHYTG